MKKEKQRKIIGLTVGGEKVIGLTVGNENVISLTIGTEIVGIEEYTKDNNEKQIKKDDTTKY